MKRLMDTNSSIQLVNSTALKHFNSALRRLLKNVFENSPESPGACNSQLYTVVLHVCGSIIPKGERFKPHQDKKNSHCNLIR